MSTEPFQPKKLYTVAEANAALPLIKAIAGDLVALSRTMLERRERLELLKDGRNFSDGDPYDEELVEVEADLEADAKRLRDYADELGELGVELKGLPDGLVDFPCEMDGRIVYLCWKFGEPEVSHWHELDGGFRGRQPLPVIADS
ncbi:MAG: DUF2203 domain-containing protein [bacterium]|nr:DUF2203 domain-containing protein [bacterium]